MRDPAFQRRMSLLAIGAMLLLALLPTAGRLASARGDASGGWAQMCTLSGLQLVKILRDRPSDHAVPKPGGHAGTSDCPYCPLANAIVALVLCAFLVLPLPVLRAAPRRGLVRWTLRRHPCGLGSRGPPGRFHVFA